jgi:ATP-dependent Clp protease ATP-binding subunit ClpB
MLKIEKEALKKETDPASQERLQSLEKELEEKERAAHELTDLWLKEKCAVSFFLFICLFP